MGRVVGGVVAIIAGLAVFPIAGWLHQPGFAGDPDVRLLEGGAYSAVLAVAVGLVVAGVVLIGTGLADAAAAELTRPFRPETAWSYLLTRWRAALTGRFE